VLFVKYYVKTKDEILDIFRAGWWNEGIKSLSKKREDI
jgi:hypothetical protein